MTNVNRVDDPTGTAIKALLEVAKLKKLSDRKKLQGKLDHLVNVNDRHGSFKFNDVYIERAEKVADVLRKQIAPLLK